MAITTNGSENLIQGKGSKCVSLQQTSLPSPFPNTLHDGEGLVKLRELVKTRKSQDVEIFLKKTELDSYKRVLSEIKSKEIRSIIVDTKPENMHHFLRMILQLQMNDYNYHYLFTTFDIETFDLEDFKYNLVNITAFRLVDADDVGVRGILRDIEKYHSGGNNLLNKSRVIE
ncbi:hypothetical protein QAD02_000114, partial [Eretmocerus hayati]